MAIYAVQGLYAFRCLLMINALFRSGFNVSLLAHALERRS